jgi:hypothetical protein
MMTLKLLTRSESMLNKPFLPDFAGNSQHGFVQNSIGAPHSLIASSMIGGAGL